MFTFPVGFFTDTSSSTPRPSWTNVRLLVDFEGVNNGVLFYDRSSYQRIVTVSGETKTVTSRYPTGATSSGYFRGNNPYQFGGTRDLLTIGTPNSLIIGSNDWTIEGYAYIEGSKTDSYSPHVHLLYGRTGPEGSWFFSEWLYVDSLNRKLTFSTNFSQGSSSFGSIETPANSVPIGSFFHYAFVKAGTLWRIFINGEVKASGGNQHLNGVSYPVTIGAQNNGSAYSYDLKGNLSWTRVCDVALYTQNFIPPTIPYSDPYWNNVVLYLPLTGTNGQTTFTDVSQYGHAVTRNGDTVISTAQAPALTGVSSSAYFDGDGDWLTLPTSTFLDLGSANDFTVEFFFRYLDTTWPYPVILGSGLASWTSGNWNITFDDTGFPGRVNKISLAMASGASLVTTNAFTIGTWHYAAFCRRSGQYEFWVNGTSEGTTSSLGGINLSGGRVGVAGHATDQRWYGNLSHLRVTKGVARDVSTVPTAPFPIG